MKPYTFYIFRHGHEVPDFDFIYCDGDNEAKSAALLLLGRERATVAVEVFDGRHGRWRIRADDGALSPGGAGSEGAITSQMCTLA